MLGFVTWTYKKIHKSVCHLSFFALAAFSLYYFCTPKMKINLSKNIIKSIRGGLKIGYEGYFYNFVGHFINVDGWRCNKRGCNLICEVI